jgi:hypothetical protein
VAEFVSFSDKVRNAQFFHARLDFLAISLAIFCPIFLAGFRCAPHPGGRGAKLSGIKLKNGQDLHFVGDIISYLGAGAESFAPPPATAGKLWDFDRGRIRRCLTRYADGLSLSF